MTVFRLGSLGPATRLASVKSTHNLLLLDSVQINLDSLLDGVRHHLL
jgi:hypothetical protein